MNKKVFGIMTGAVLFGAVYFFFAIKNQPVTENQLVVEYRNAEYGFFIPFAENWKGYTMVKKTWEGRFIDGANVPQTSVSGPLIVLRHPAWTETQPREDMPIMVFTPEQWNLVVQEKISLGAAPIPPSILGQNSKYIFALPARYNYDFKPGWEEVDQLVHKLQAFEPTW